MYTYKGINALSVGNFDYWRVKSEINREGNNQVSFIMNFLGARDALVLTQRNAGKR